MKKLLLSVALSTAVFGSYAESVQYNVRWLLEQTLCPSTVESLKAAVMQTPGIDAESEEAKIGALAVDFIAQWMENNCNQVTDIYLRYFTEDEIQQLVDLYKSPLGKKMIEQQGAMMVDVMQLIQQPAMDFVLNLPGQLAQNEILEN